MQKKEKLRQKKKSFSGGFGGALFVGYTNYHLRQKSLPNQRF